jgi:hypothetical protein
VVDFLQKLNPQQREEAVETVDGLSAYSGPATSQKISRNLYVI